MNHMEFEIGLKKLERNYTSEDKLVQYTNDQKDILWNRFQKLNIRTWNKAIDELIDGCMYLPKTSNFHKVINEMAMDDVKKDIRYIHEDCDRCDSSGLRIGIFKDADAFYFWTAVARCVCNNAENFCKSIPTVAMVEHNDSSGLVEWASGKDANRRMDELRREEIS